MMRVRSILYRLVLSLSVNAVAGGLPEARAQSVSLGGPVRLADGAMRLTITGSSAGPVTLQGSADMKEWRDIESFTLNGAPVTYTDEGAAGQGMKYYRVKAGGVVEPPVVLPDLSGLLNEVFIPGEGFDTIQYAPNGSLGLIVWKNTELVFRERGPEGWREQVVTGGGSVFEQNRTRTDYKFQPAALLLYDSASRPHVFKVSGGASISHFTRSGGSWSLSETLNNSQAGGSLEKLVGAVGANDVFHLAALTSGDTQTLSYGSNKNGQWSWSRVTGVGGDPNMYLPWTYAVRSFSMAVDSRNNAYIAFRPEFTISFHAQGYPRAYSELACASNASGQWSIQTVAKPRDISGEAGQGASIAVGPDDKPYIASWYNERADTGSAQWSRLHYHQRDGSGNWSSSIAVSRPEYIAGDGEKGTGFAPYLRFDSRGRAHIIFSDHAAEHFWNSGQSEYTGQIRHAWWNGSGWEVETVFEQRTPILEQMVYPAFAMSGSEIAVMGLQRLTAWNMDIYPPAVASNYKLAFVTRPLR